MKFQKIAFVVCLIATIVLLVAGFCVPPTGIIDGSVLTASGELFGFATLATIGQIAHYRNVHLTHGKTKVEIGEDEEKNDEQ